MTDLYEAFFGLDGTNPSDADADFDDDTLANLAEAMLMTDPFAPDTDTDGLDDAEDIDPLSRAAILWGNPRFTTGDSYFYTGPTWWLGAGKSGGIWTNSTWTLPPYSSGQLLVDVDPALLPGDLMLDMVHSDTPDSGVAVFFEDDLGNRTIIEEDITDGSGVQGILRLALPLSLYTNTVRIVVDAETDAQAYPVWASSLYVDNDADGLDAGQEAQFGTSDANADSDGDGLNDYSEAMVLGTDPADADTDHDSLGDLLELQQGSDPLVPVWQTGGLPGVLQGERWDGIEGDTINLFVGDLRFGGPCDAGLLLESSEYVPAGEKPDAGDHYGMRIRGTITPAVSGTYTFLLTGNDFAQVWLSPSASPYDRSLLLELEAWTDPRDIADPDAVTTTVELVAGHECYVEILHLETEGTDHVSLLWLPPGAAQPSSIGPYYLHGYVQPSDDLDADGLPDDWEAAHGLDPLDGTGGGYADFDGDGYCDIVEYAMGTDPADADFDGDGIVDGDELLVTLTNPCEADSDGDGISDLVPAIDIPAWDYDAWFDSHESSTWSNDGAVAIASAPQYAPWVEYGFDVAEAGMYRLAVDTSFAGTIQDKAHEIRLEVLIDGTIVEEVWMNHSPELPGYTLFTPWLVAGPHRLKIKLIDDYWNPEPFTIHSIVFSAVDGTDSNADGVQDWAQTILATGVDTDGDGLSDFDEAFALGTYPTVADLDRDGIDDALELQRGSSPFIPSWNEGGVDGELLAERWNSIEGWSADNLGGSDRFGSDPDSIMLLSSAEYAPENLNAGDTYGLRIRGLLTAPATGTYTFSLTGDDSAELWLSDSSSPYGRSQLLDLPLWTTLHDLTDPRTPSASVDLVAGQSYAFEILLKEHSLEEHVTLWWQVPGASEPEIIGSQYVHSYVQPADDLDGDGLPDAWEAAHGLDPESGIGGGYADFDGDSWCDIEEYVLGTDPADADADGDGLSGGEESTITLTDPNQADTDGDGIEDLVAAIDIPAWSYDAWFDSHISSTWSNDG
ncbi:MAG: hypothetical protein JXJ30_02555, partial [Halothiobacillaceae bacterium]|nr:hypothetical protein [Halothiobacillaceae bacterium]